MLRSVHRHTKGIPFLLLSLAAMLVVAPVTGCAQKAAEEQYPTKAIEVIVPAGPGGATDQVGRILGGYLQKKWGQPLNVINKGGGGGAPAGASVVQSAADGYTVMMLSVNNPILADAVQTDLPYHWDSLTYLSRVGVSGLVFVVKSDSKYKTLKELADDIKANPSQIKYSTSAVSGPSTFASSQLAEAAGVDPNAIGRVPFSTGGAASVAAVAGGHTAFAAQLVAEVVELVKGGQLRALAVTTPERDPDMPDVPTTKELGFESVKQMGQFGLGGPANLPAPVVKKWDEAVAEALKDQQFQSEMRKIGVVPSYLNSKDYRTWVESEYKAARAAAEKMGLRQ